MNRFENVSKPQYILRTLFYQFQRNEFSANSITKIQQMSQDVIFSAIGLLFAEIYRVAQKLAHFLYAL